MRTFTTEVEVEIDEDEMIEYLEESGYTIVSGDCVEVKDLMKAKSKNLGDAADDAAIAVKMVKDHRNDGLREFLTQYLNLPYLTDKETIIKALAEAMG